MARLEKWEFGMKTSIYNPSGETQFVCGTITSELMFESEKLLDSMIEM